MRYVTPYILKRIEDDFSNRTNSSPPSKQEHKIDARDEEFDGESDYYVCIYNLLS